MLYLALRGLIEKPEMVGGQTFLAGDDTEAVTVPLWWKPFLEDQKLGLPKFYIPFWIIYGVALLMEFISWIISPIFEWKPLLTIENVLSVNVRVTHRYEKAKKILNYQPIHSYQQSLNNTRQYFKENYK